MTSTLTRPPEPMPQVAASPRPSSRRWLVGATIAVLGGLAVVFFGRSLVGAVTPHLYSGTVLQQSTPAPPMTGLEFASGEPVDLGVYDGDVVLLYFGYMGCPDVCPTTLSGASQAIDDLPADQQERVHLLMVTIDPARDEPEALQRYTEAFHPTFQGVSGEELVTKEVATTYGVFVARGGETAPDEYFVDHTATLMAIGTDGALRVVWPPTVTSDELAGDLRELLG